MHYQILRLTFWLLLLGGLALALILAPRAILAQDGRSHPFVVYLPHVTQADAFTYIPKLWSHTEPPARHEVTLLRCTLHLPTPLNQAELQVFADTRYQAWVNGVVAGRGPARFSHMRREYDRLPLSNLPAGSLVLAVQAQWAPNLRRSESVDPHVQMRLVTPGFTQVLTPEQCRAWRSTAWNPHPAHVHAWGILGPSEQLDLRLLPVAWQAPVFDDRTWSPAVLRPGPGATTIYQPRSIAQLVDVPITARVHTAGYLAPGLRVGALPPQNDGSAQYRFTLTQTTPITLMMLTNPGYTQPPSSVNLNAVPLVWSPVPNAPPDLRQSQTQLGPGQHLLQVNGLNPGDEPWAFAISQAATQLTPPPTQTGHAGRRLLLADLVPAEGVVAIRPGAQLDLLFQQGPAYVVLDLGRTIHGRLVAEVEGPAGTVVDLGWDERLWNNVRPLPHPGSLHPEWNQVDTWVLAEGIHTLTTLDARAGRYVLIAVWGEEPVTLRHVQVYEERYPVTLQGSFTSSNARLDQIWMLGPTTLYPSMQDAYADPWRERGQWWGDAHIADRVNQVTFGETALLRRGLQQIADSVTDGPPTAFAPNGTEFLLDYGMLWIQSAYEYGTLTGDWAFVASLYPRMVTFMHFLAANEDPQTNLLDLSRIDSPIRIAYFDSISYWDRMGQSTAINAFYYRALHNMAAINQALGRDDEAERWQARAIALRTRINQLLYRPAEGRYMAGLLNGTLTPATPQAQSAALTFGLPPDGTTDRVTDAMLEMLGTPQQPRVQVLGLYYVLEGLGQAGRIDDGLDVIERFFGFMLDRGATTWWENLGADQTYRASLSHAWGGSPTWFLSTYALGAQQLDQGRWRVDLHHSRLTEMHGTIPLAEGLLSVHRVVNPCQEMTVTLTAPVGTTGVVRLPDAAHIVSLSLDDHVIWARDTAATSTSVTLVDTALEIALDGGSYQLHTHRHCDRAVP
ncbi:family 78 glycoside hydrolase catalytic domain [Candidatus Chloroploca sp. M-50]|uniref:Family 78 glycoside hydrolase catalytic domain n=1 Tax=Candidatus Chloroploca mongolica TaxID=2528176 RepID=A0ABS4D6X8_9CHLR|nr:family 78 glycoside hydrolase catalytic domain [Candidatus Chloroploca mongolica]MBP1465170.1 family 78 glycoside hydrolase catalytic domain [Candidatus Chloroploca mongolica]